MKIVSKQTLQKLIRHQLLEHYTKKFNLLTEGNEFNNDTLRQKIDILLPDKCPIEGFDSPQTTVRDCLILICLYELINSANVGIQNKLSRAGITIDPKIVTAISDAIKGFFEGALTVGWPANSVNYKDNNAFITDLGNKIKVPFKKNEFLINLPSFLKQFIMKAEDLSSQITSDLCRQVIDGAAGVSGVWKNDNNTVAIPLNPWAGASYNSQLKERTPDGIISKLENAIDQIVAETKMSATASTETPEEKKKREEEAAAKLSEKQKKKEERKKKIEDLKTKSGSAHNISRPNILQTQDIKDVNAKYKKGPTLGTDLHKKVKYNTETLVTQLFVYYLFLNAAEKSGDNSTIYNINNFKIKDMISIIDKNAEDGSKFDGKTGDYENYILQNLSQKKLGFNINHELYNAFGDDRIRQHESNTKLEGGLKKLYQTNESIIAKINSITKEKNPLANNIKLFLNQITENQFKEIRDAVASTSNLYPSFDYYDNMNVCATRVHNTDKIITSITNYIFDNIFDQAKGGFSVAQNQMKKSKEELDRLNKEDADEEAADKAEAEKAAVDKAAAEKDKATQLQSPNQEIISDEEWDKVIQRIKILQKTPKKDRNHKEISDIKKIIRLLEHKGISKEKVQQALKDLEVLEQEGQSGVSETGSGNDKDAESETDSDSNDEVDDNDGLEDIFRLPQLNKGYFQLARILTDTAALRSYKSGNFKREKYDKADSYGYIFMDDNTLNKAGDVYNVAVKTIVAKMGSRGVNLSPEVQNKIATELKDYKKIGDYLNEYFNKKMLLANEYLYIDGKVYLYLALRVLEDVGLDSTEFKELHDEFVVNKDPVVLPHNIKIQNLDDALAKKVDLSKRISIDQMFQNRKAKVSVIKNNEKKQTADVNVEDVSLKDDRETYVKKLYDDIIALKKREPNIKNEKREKYKTILYGKLEKFMDTDKQYLSSEQLDNLKKIQLSIRGIKSIKKI